jgi:hypothetical protein
MCGRWESDCLFLHSFGHSGVHESVPIAGLLERQQLTLQRGILVEEVHFQCSSEKAKFYEFIEKLCAVGADNPPDLRTSKDAMHERA